MVAVDNVRLLAAVRTILVERPRIASHSEVTDIIRVETTGTVSGVKVLEILRIIHEGTVGVDVLGALLRYPGVSDALVTAPGEV